MSEVRILSAAAALPAEPKTSFDASTDQTRVVSTDEMATLVAHLPFDLLLTVAANALRIAQARRYRPADANANRNCLTGAALCIERLLAGPAPVALEPLAREDRA